MHTEAEAREKWCPEKRLSTSPSGRPEIQCTANWVEPANMAHMGCEASGCMMWRWMRPFPQGVYDGQGRPDDTTRAKMLGYCGKAGRP